MTVRAAWLPPAGQTRADTRAAPTGTMTPAGPLTTAPGIIPGGNPLALTGTAGLQAQLDVGRAIVQGTTAQGAYSVVVTVPEVLTFTPGHAQYDRLDLVVLRVYDTLFDSTGKSLAVVEIVPGLPAAAPQPPATPACSLPLWQVRVPVGASAITWASALTDLRAYTVAAGGIRPDASTTPGAYVGQLRDTGARIERWSGTAWVPYPAALGGIAPSTLAAGSYIGQWRDGANGPERWNGSAWQPFGAWTAYTPTWTATTTNPILGNGTLVTRYSRVGKTITYVGTLRAGTTTNGGNGVWNMTLPVQAANNGITVQGPCSYVAFGSNNYIGNAAIAPGATAVGFTVKTATNAAQYDNVSNTVPVATSSVIGLSWAITYESV
ncbi:hypothetical protein [Streptomyces sp. NRRL B-24484]|uniref:hypothetical protein n=1 Tax=Streptomyces sp. NRRL B-24484 TaxID=1463833 RepID=UPI0006940D58|nr:hypothetical protein [Streptomyces sp. NRRL B-24484]